VTSTRWAGKPGGVTSFSVSAVIARRARGTSGHSPRPSPRTGSAASARGGRRGRGGAARLFQISIVPARLQGRPLRGYHALSTDDKTWDWKQPDQTISTLLVLDRSVLEQEGGFWIKIEARRVEPTEFIPHGIRYSLTLHNRYGARLLGYDNAHAVKPPGKFKFAGQRLPYDQAPHCERQGRAVHLRFGSGIVGRVFCRGGQGDCRRHPRGLT